MAATMYQVDVFAMFDALYKKGKVNFKDISTPVDFEKKNDTNR